MTSLFWMSAGAGLAAMIAATLNSIAGHDNYYRNLVRDGGTYLCVVLFVAAICAGIAGAA